MLWADRAQILPRNNTDDDEYLTTRNRKITDNNFLYCNCSPKGERITSSICLYNLCRITLNSFKNDAFKLIGFLWDLNQELVFDRSLFRSGKLYDMCRTFQFCKQGWLREDTLNSSLGSECVLEFCPATKFVYKKCEVFLCVYAFKL